MNFSQAGKVNITHDQCTHLSLNPSNSTINQGHKQQFSGSLYEIKPSSRLQHDRKDLLDELKQKNLTFIENIIDVQAYGPC